MSSSSCTARGVSPSPHVFSRGNRLRSTAMTSTPALANQYAAADPAGPPPTTTTWWRAVFIAEGLPGWRRGLRRIGARRRFEVGADVLASGRLLAEGDEARLRLSPGEHLAFVAHDEHDVFGRPGPERRHHGAALGGRLVLGPVGGRGPGGRPGLHPEDVVEIVRPGLGDRLVLVRR